MDRNDVIRPAIDVFLAVALRKESVDRNNIRIAPIDSIIDVALRKESVDRNIPEEVENHEEQTSLSARRAWIEIRMALFPAPPTMSLSARRAWIEILLCGPLSMRTSCRSPQGERG